VTQIPPYAELLKLGFEEVDGEVRVTMPFHDDVIGRPGFLHGGAIAGLLEFAAFTSLAREIGDDSVAMKPVTVNDRSPGSTARRRGRPCSVNR